MTEIIRYSESVLSDGSELNRTPWEPSIIVRPHHLASPDIQGAIIGKEIIVFNKAQSDWLLRNYPRDVEPYQADTYGAGENGASMNDPLKAALRELDDDDVVQLSLGKDKTCESCVIGKHCTATNYSLFGDLIDTAVRESSKIEWVLEDLIGKGLVEGIDFIFREISTELLDYSGKKFWADVEPVPQTVTFQAMLVKMHALRKIFAR